MKKRRLRMYIYICIIIDMYRKEKKIGNWLWLAFWYLSLPSFSLAAVWQWFFWLLVMVRWTYLQMEPFVYVLFDLVHRFVVAVDPADCRHATIVIDHFPFSPITSGQIDWPAVNLKPSAKRDEREDFVLKIVLI